MPQLPLYQYFETLGTGGGTVNIDVADMFDSYVFNGTGTLSSNWTIQPNGTPAAYVVVKIYYNCQFVLNGSAITIFGANINQEQALNGQVLIEATYDPTLGSPAWVVIVKQSAGDEPPNYEGVETTTLLAAGGTITLVPGINTQWQELVGSPVMVANYAVTAPLTPGQFLVHWSGTATPGGNTLTIFGITLTDSQFINGNVLVFAYFDVPNNVWRSQLIAQPNDINFYGSTDTPLSAIGATVITLTNGTSTQYQRITGAGTLGGIGLVNFTGSFRDGQQFFIKYDAQWGLNGFSVTILGEVLTASQALNGNVMVIATWENSLSGFSTQLVQNPSSVLAVENIYIPVSFQNNEQCSNFITVGYDATITNISAAVTLALAGTDAGVIDPKINGVSMTDAGLPLSIPLSSALDTVVTSTVTGANTIVAGDVISFVATKTTPGGKCIVTLTLTRT